MHPQKRILTLSVSAGAGHVRAAQALCDMAHANCPDVELMHLDLMELVPSGFRRIYSRGFLQLVEKAPLLWAYLYQQTDHPPRHSVLEGFRRRVERLNTTRLDDELAHYEPHAIICTHFLPAELLSRRIRKGEPTPPVWVQVTDFDVHGMWLHPHMAGYFVASDEVAARLHGRGVAREQIHVTGIAVSPRFTQAPSRQEAAAELGLDPAKTTLLMLSGGAGVGDIGALFAQLAALPRDMQIIALAGHNAELLRQLQAVAATQPTRLRALGFTDSIERVMAAADIAITKPGGLTTSECLAMSLPMIVVSPIPGQEERNADMLLESGCALKAVDAASLAFKVQTLVDHPMRLQQMRARQQAIAKPHAAQTILDIVRHAL